MEIQDKQNEARSDGWAQTLAPVTTIASVTIGATHVMLNCIKLALTLTNQTPKYLPAAMGHQPGKTNEVRTRSYN